MGKNLNKSTHVHSASDRFHQCTIFFLLLDNYLFKLVDLYWLEICEENKNVEKIYPKYEGKQDYMERDKGLGLSYYYTNYTFR